MKRNVEKSLERVSNSLSEICCTLRNIPVAALDPELTQQLTSALELCDLALGNVLEAQGQMSEGTVRKQGTVVQRFLERHRAEGRYDEAIVWALAGLGSICTMWLGPDGYVRMLRW